MTRLFAKPLYGRLWGFWSDVKSLFSDESAEIASVLPQAV